MHRINSHGAKRNISARTNPSSNGRGCFETVQDKRIHVDLQAQACSPSPLLHWPSSAEDRREMKKCEEGSKRLLPISKNKNTALSSFSLQFGHSGFAMHTKKNPKGPGGGCLNRRTERLWRKRASHILISPALTKLSTVIPGRGFQGAALSNRPRFAHPHSEGQKYAAEACQAGKPQARHGTCRHMRDTSAQYAREQRKYATRRANNE